MLVAHLSLTDFRCYHELSLACEPGPNVFAGENGQGKTSLLEAIGYLSTLASHRSALDAPLVRQGAPRAVVRTEVRDGGRRLLVELEITPGRTNRARLAGAPVPRPREILGAVRAVLFAPDDLALVQGDPGERRRFLDELLTVRFPRYAAVRSDFDRVLKQRNALLKSVGGFRQGPGNLPTLDVWDDHLARTGAALIIGRLELLDLLGPLVDKAHTAVAPGGGAVSLAYRSSIDPAGDDEAPVPAAQLRDREAVTEALRAALARQRRAELDRGITLVGPHRDDLTVTLGTLPARGYASHGESWCLALALRLAAYDLLRSDGREPVLLLDDVFAELDGVRRARLAELVGAAEQALITCAVAEDLPAGLRGARFSVREGQVGRVD
jgi:DNA replication and repair protein RecF